MKLDIALKNILHVPEKVLEDEILCIRENREQAIPVLLERIKDISKNSNWDGKHFYPLYLLAEFRVNETFPHIIKLLEFDEDMIDYLLGDSLCDEYPQLIASVARIGDIPRIKEVIENKELFSFARTTALHVLKILYVEGVYPRDDYFIYLKSLLETTYGDYEFWDWVANDTCDVGFKELLPLIEKNFGESNDEIRPMDLDYARKALSKANEAKKLEKLKKDKFSTFWKDTIKELSKWAYFNDDDDDDYDYRVSYKEPHIADQKISRNSSCPCVSGKKFKKCCGK